VSNMPKIIKDIGPTRRLINPKKVAKALGAEYAGVKIDTKQGPISLFSLRQILVNMLHSTGGRPKLKGTQSKRTKISLFNDDWEKLKTIAKYIEEEEGRNVSPGQIASLLIHTKIEDLLPKNMIKKWENKINA